MACREIHVNPGATDAMADIVPVMKDKIFFFFFKSKLQYAAEVNWETPGKPSITHDKRWCIPMWILVWLLPMVLAGCGFILQNFQLRIATYYYVHKMVEYDLPHFKKYEEESNDIPLTVGSSPNKPSFGSLNDPVEEYLGKYHPVNIHILDVLAAAFPFLFFISTVACDQPVVWTRIMVSFFFLSTMKGFFAWITVEPDSNGWQVCQERLSSSSYNVEWYSETRSTMELFLMNPASRLCADMMYSGHTYFVTIFALGLNECARLALMHQRWILRASVETLILVVAVCQQTIEIYFVLKSHFHYTADVAMAVIITYLVYTNTTIAVIANKWTRPNDYRKVCPVNKSGWFLRSLTHNVHINIGCCPCVPWNMLYIFTHESVNKLIKDIESANDHVHDNHGNVRMTPTHTADFMRMRMHVMEDTQVVEPVEFRAVSQGQDK